MSLGTEIPLVITDLHRYNSNRPQPVIPLGEKLPMASVHDLESIPCTCCGKPLMLGSLYYNVSVRVEAAFDGYLNADELLSEGKSSQSQMNKMLDLIQHTSAETLEGDVSQVVTAQLCVMCKNALLGLVFGYLPSV